METAENIAKSCKLIQPGFEILRFRLQDKISPELAKSKSRANMDGVNDERNAIVLRELKVLVERAEVLEGDGTSKALLIEGSDLTYVLESDECKR